MSAGRGKGPARLALRGSLLGCLMCFQKACEEVAMRALGFDVKKADVLKILKDYDRESTGKITFEDFNEVAQNSVLMKTYKVKKNLYLHPKELMVFFSENLEF
ncbi:hypothetical protein Nmel_008473 [Mimus melanotis]